MSKKNATKENEIDPLFPKKEKVTKSTVELISYEIKAVIPTGAYANIQPCIIVKAKNLEEAEGYVTPHIEMLYKRYLNFTERKPPVTVNVPSTAPKQEAPVTTTLPETKVPEGNVSVSFAKARQAINSCLNAEALTMIEHQITASTKLTTHEKLDLMALLPIKTAELDGKSTR